jgi:hypothetical protein
MNINRLLAITVIFTAILVSGASGAARFVTDSAVGARSSSSAIDPHGLHYIPDSVIITKGEVVYLLSRANLSLFRWSVVQRQYLPSISLAQAPDLMAYSEETDRIYLSYPDKHITQIKLDQTPLQELPYIQVQESVSGLATAGSYVFTHDNLGEWGTNYTYGPNGNFISSNESRYYSAEYTWSSANRKFYYYQDDGFPRGLFWEAIAEDGALGENYGGFYVNWPVDYPIRVKPDGSDVLIGSGVIIDATTLSWKAELPNYVQDATWTCGNLYSLRTWFTASRAQKWGEGYSLEGEVGVMGAPARLFPVSEGLLYITQLLDMPWFTILDCQLAPVYELPFTQTFIPVTDIGFCPDLFDDFSNPASGWATAEDDYVRSEYVDGEFRVLTKDDRYMYLYSAPGCEAQAYHDYSVEVDARWVGEPGFGFGLLFEISPDFEQYNFVIVNTERQEYGIYQEKLGILSAVVPFTYSSAIQPYNENNHLKIFQEANGWTNLEINQVQVNGGFNTLEGPVYVGLGVIPYYEYPVSDARFDNFQLIFSVPDTSIGLQDTPELAAACRTYNLRTDRMTISKLPVLEDLVKH